MKKLLLTIAGAASALTAATLTSCGGEDKPQVKAPSYKVGRQGISDKKANYIVPTPDKLVAPMAVPPMIEQKTPVKVVK